MEWKGATSKTIKGLEVGGGCRKLCITLSPGAPEKSKTSTALDV